jgi:hypothetical protein
VKFDFAFDLDRDLEREFGNADRAPGVRANRGAEDFDDEIREAVDDRRLIGEAGRGVDHSEDSGPGADAIEASELTLKAAEDSEAGETGGEKGLLLRNVLTDLPEWLSE